MSEFAFGTYDAAFVQAMYEEYLRDPASVGSEWRELFENGKLAELPVIPVERAPSAVSRTPASAARQVFRRTAHRSRRTQFQRMPFPSPAPPLG